MQRSRTRLRVGMVGMLQIVSGLDCDGNNNLITATTRPSTISSSYTILPLCFSSTHTRQSANSAYHNNTQQQKRVSYITWGKLSLELLSLVVWESPSISALCTPISAKICHLFWHFCQAMLNAFKKVMATQSKVQKPGRICQDHHCTDSLNTT